MKKITFSILCFFIIANVAAQKKPNPKIGKQEAETTLFIFQDRSNDAGMPTQFGTQFVYRWALKKYTKVGAGGFIAGEIGNYVGTSKNLFLYGTLFADITRFLDVRQKWSLSGQLGYVIYNDRNEGETINDKDYEKHTGGMYYSLVLNYRVIISSRTLFTISPLWNSRYFHHSFEIDHKSPPSIERFEKDVQHTALGIKVGFVM